MKTWTSVLTASADSRICRSWK